MAISSVRRTSSCGSDRRNNSLTKLSRDRPITIWVTFSNFANRSSSAGRVRTGQRLRFSAKTFGQVSSLHPAFGERPASRFVPGLSTVTAIQGASIRSASRLAARTTVGDIGSGPMQAKNALARSPRAFDGLRLHAFDQVGIDPLGCAPQRKLTQRRQILRLEEILDRARRGVLRHRPCLRRAA